MKMGRPMVITAMEQFNGKGEFNWLRRVLDTAYTQK